MADDDAITAAFVASIAALGLRLNEALPGIALQGASIVEAEVIRRAPVDTGAMRSSVDEHAVAQGPGYASATVAVENSSESGIEHYAIYQEFGTSRMPANPFVRPALQAVRGQVTDLIEQQVLNVLTS